METTARCASTGPEHCRSSSALLRHSQWGLTYTVGTEQALVIKQEARSPLQGISEVKYQYRVLPSETLNLSCWGLWEWDASRSQNVSLHLEFLKGNVSGYACNHGSLSVGHYELCRDDIGGDLLGSPNHLWLKRKRQWNWLVDFVYLSRSPCIRV